MKFTYKNNIAIWSVFTISLIGLYFLSLSQEIGTAFFLLLNIVNAALIVTFFLFKKKIIALSQSLKETFNAIQQKSNDQRIIIEFSNESKVGLTLTAALSIAAIYILYLAAFDSAAYRILIKEDGIIEYSSSIFWFLSAITLLISTIKFKLTGRIYNLWLIPYILLIMFFIVCGGEEISWGQRLLNLNTPEFLKSINVQNEITLHNIGSISVFSNAFFLLTILYFWGVPFVKSNYPNIGKLIDFYALPSPNRFATLIYSISIGIWLFIGIRFGTLGFHPFSFYEENYYTQMDDEMFEFLAAYSFFCFSLMDSLKTSYLKK